MENKEKESMPASKKKMIFVVLAVILIAAIVVVALSMKKTQSPSGENNQGGEQNQGEQANVEGEGEAEQNTDASVDLSSEELQKVEIADIENAVVVVPGANAITKDNKVVTAEGVVTDSAAIPMSDNAPKQTGFLVREELPSSIVQLEVGNGKFSPNQFTTKPGAPTTFSLTSVDEYVHIINFDDQAVSAVSILVGPGQTKAITFNAPTEAGEYTFRCNVPGHAEEGETGKMIVR